MASVLAVAPPTDISDWLRGRGLEIVLLVLGTLLLARFATWSGRRITEPAQPRQWSRRIYACVAVVAGFVQYGDAAPRRVVMPAPTACGFPLVVR